MGILEGRSAFTGLRWVMMTLVKVAQVRWVQMRRRRREG